MALFLSEFNIVIKHQPRKSLTQADTLSQRSGHDGGENDNKDVVLLGPELFAKAVNVELQERIRDSKLRDNSVVEYITLKGKATKRPEFGKPEDWSDDDGILLYKNRVYVPPDHQLYRDIVKMHHDAPIMGHPGVQKTYDLVKREYMWPGMRKFIVQYVKGCAACQTSKVNMHPIKPGLIPIQHSGDTRPFRTITMDYITDLPESDGFNAVQVVVDHDVSKAAVFSPCTKNITAEGAMDILQRDVYRRFGLPAKVISDRGPQFISKAFKELHNSLGIETALSTAYHPQTDGETERVNQELDLALRLYCANNPENWAKLLPQFEFAHNQRTHSVTGKSPFELLYGFQPEAAGTVRTTPKHPSTEQRLQSLQEARENTIAAHAQAAAAMSRRLPAAQVPLKLGDKVLLDTKNLRLPYVSRKLIPKRVGPFTIVKVLGPVTFKLKLPEKWKIHPVFHAALLTPYHTTKEHGPDYVRPPPIPTPELTEGAEWEVEAILSHRTRGTQKQYLVAWKGWPASENSWEPEKHLKNAQSILRNYKKRHKLSSLVAASLRLPGATSLVPPNFIRERRTVFYNHLPRHTVSANDEGTLADRIGWVIVHPHLYSHVEARIAYLPEVKDLIDIYRSLARAAPSYGVLVNYNKRTSAPRSEKKKVDQVANEAYQAVIQAAEKVLSMLANPQIAGALSDLMPLRNQHGTHSWGHIFWPQRLDDYPEAIEVDEDEDADVSSVGGWSIPSTDPWKVSTPDPEEEAIKWGQTSDQESTPSLTSSSSDSSYSEVESFDLLPELEHLKLSMVDEVDKLPEEEFHEALKVAVRAPSPPPPPPTMLTKNVEEPQGRCRFFRGTGEDRLGYVNSNGDIFVVPNNPFGISITRIMVAYHLRWPEASVRTTMAAALIIDDVLARQGNFPAFKIEAERTPTTYRQALGMSAAESAQWDCIRAVGNESDLVDISLDVFHPEVVERNQNIIVHA
ncbi:hypothetical protein ONZ51_g7817 [Trametes cubensis]|uniref:Uncharacterized protein n=1 Tax=Trametes cubensis TaxID=1111947 RepID=A0AAD7TPU2_9APHY|nr:hypothetical protein ONZ51_g7817 [Trametes cubensis]